MSFCRYYGEQSCTENEIYSAFNTTLTNASKLCYPTTYYPYHKESFLGLEYLKEIVIIVVDDLFAIGEMTIVKNKIKLHWGQN